MFRKSPEKKFLLAAQKGDTVAMAALLEKGVDVNTRTADGETALRIACMNNDVPAARFLLKMGADVNMSDAEGRSPLSRAAGEGFNALLKLLLAAPGINVDAQKLDGDTALRLAVMHNQLESVRLLLAAGANPDIQNGDGNTPLIRAASEGYTEITKLLLEHGANPHIRNNNLYTAASFANANTQLATLQLISDFIAAQKTPAPLPAAAPEETAEKPHKHAAAQWHVTDDQEIARVASKPALGLEVTEIFNFRAARVITIIKDVRQKTEATLEKNFADVEGEGWLAEAAKVYEAQTGAPALLKAGSLQKPKAALKPNTSP
ncbi:MAG: ankyrin repeat domain-containing protein [Alphaproteobacteria bacterium]